jgi:catechol 2,3-dioxygenase-like lactoylglutathione lyase family enzyme
MLDHITLHVSDFAASLRFYRAVLAPLGVELAIEDGESAAFGDERTFLLTSGRPVTAEVHIAFRAADTAAVEAFHAAGLANGGTDNGAPGVRAHYAPNYYAAFVLDPDGNNVEAVHMLRSS